MFVESGGIYLYFSEFMHQPDIAGRIDQPDGNCHLYDLRMVQEQQSGCQDGNKCMGGIGVC